ncbi:hypothetical protein EJ110_NYTH04987 [Nymphaea thermarum]|nr:hypothetical protein EJ110_NYTH04987 [Nymphaea thermarum]
MALAADDLRSTSSLGRRVTESFREAWGSSRDVFRRSLRAEEDDEDALRWAAIERLPTTDRMRWGVLRRVMEDGNVVHGEVDIRRLGVAGRKQLLENVLQAVQEDNEKFLLRLRERADRVGIDLPKIEVRFEGLSVEADAYVGGRALPTLLNAAINSIEGILGLVRLSPSKKRVLKILIGVTGILRPSRMTLLLGPPASGKTTLLLALAGKLDKKLRVAGKITYNGYELREFVPRRTGAYISQHDVHNAEMTVRETLDFSGRCQGVGSRYDMLAELSRREREAGIKPDPEIDAFMKAAAAQGQGTSIVTDYILKVMFSIDNVQVFLKEDKYLFFSFVLFMFALLVYVRGAITKDGNSFLSSFPNIPVLAYMVFMTSDVSAAWFGDLRGYHSGRSDEARDFRWAEEEGDHR